MLGASSLQSSVRFGDIDLYRLVDVGDLPVLEKRQAASEWCRNLTQQAVYSQFPQPVMDIWEPPEMVDAIADVVIASGRDALRYPDWSSELHEQAVTRLNGESAWADSPVSRQRIDQEYSMMARETLENRLNRQRLIHVNQDGDVFSFQDKGELTSSDDESLSNAD